MCCSSQRRSAAARYRNCADILSGVFKISLCVFAGESHCGRVRDRAGLSGVWRGLGLALWRSRFGGQVAKAAAQQQVFPVRGF